VSALGRARFSASERPLPSVAEERSVVPAQGRKRPCRQDTGGEFFGQAKESELEAICAHAIGRGLCGAIGLGIWAAIVARAGTRKRLEGDAAPSISRLAKFLGIDRSTLQRYLSVIEETGLLATEREPGRKPTWLIRPGSSAESNLPRWAAGDISHARTAGVAAQDGTTWGRERQPLQRRAAPVPPREQDGQILEKVGGTDLRISSRDSQAPEELGGLCASFASHLATLIRRSPNSQDVEMLEELAAVAGDDCEQWRALVDLAALQSNDEELRI